MRISVKVTPRSSRELVIKEGSRWKVSVRESPERGKANQKVTELIADFLGAPKGCVKIIAGFTSRVKTIEVSNGK